MKRTLMLLEVFIILLILVLVFKWIYTESRDNRVVEEPEIVIDPEIAGPEQWWTDYEWDLLATLIYYEAGSNDCSDRHQQLVAQVVINRVRSDEYPNTIYDVITDTKHGVQYSTCEKVLSNVGDTGIIPQRCFDNALIVLNGWIDCPDNVIFQANFKQGSGVYEKHNTSYSTTYFCYR